MCESKIMSQDELADLFDGCGLSTYRNKTQRKVNPIPLPRGNRGELSNYLEVAQNSQNGSIVKIPKSEIAQDYIEKYC